MDKETVKRMTTPGQQYEEYKEKGYVLFKGVVPESLLVPLREAYDAALRAKMKRLNIEPIEADMDAHDRVGLDFRPEGGNHDQNRWNMHLPSTVPFLNDTLIANPAFLPLIKRILGEDCVNIMLASDTPFPGASYQSYHQDFHREALTVNIALRDVTEEDSPLEVVPGTHRKLNKQRELLPYTAENVMYSKKELKWAINNLPKFRLTAQAGDVIVRDQRMIHRGTSHEGTHYRPLLALWYKQAPKKTALSKVSIPVPHRKTANRIAARALDYRNQGRAKENAKLINIGSLLGRIVDEGSATDRDYRRVIPAEIWQRLSPDSQQLLRYAEVEGRSHNEVQRYKKGDRILNTLALLAKVWKAAV